MHFDLNLKHILCRYASRTLRMKLLTWCRFIGVARGAKGDMLSPKFLENIVILCFERRFSKQNSVIRLKSNILDPPIFWPSQIFGLATPLFRVISRAGLGLRLVKIFRACIHNFFVTFGVTIFFFRGVDLLCSPL